MVNIIFPDGTTLVAVIANLNVFTSNPSVSIGEGEIIYNSTNNKPYINIGTIGSPNWSDISGGEGVTDHGELTGLADNDHPQYLLTTSPNLPLSYSAGNLGLNWGSSLALSGNDLVVNPANVDHGALGGLSGDDHTQYYNSTRHTKAIHDSLAIDHGSLGGKSDNDHPQYLLTTSPNLPLSYSAGNLGLNWGSSLALSGNDLVVNPANVDHGALGGLSGDDHTQYLLISGSRAMSGNLNLNDNEITNCDTLTGRDDLELAIVSGYQNLALYPDTGYQVDIAGELDMNSNKIVGLDAPTANTDAATKLYVDDAPSSDGVYVCTSSTRPTATEGRTIYETDTDKILAYSGTSNLKIIIGNAAGTFNGFYWTGSTWTSDSSIVSGLGDVGLTATPIIFLDGSTLKLIAGEDDGVFNGYYWSGSAWISDSSIVSGLGDIGGSSAPCVFLDGSTLKLISGNAAGTFNGFYWTGSTWTSDSSIVSGLGDVGYSSAPCVFDDDGTWKIIIGEGDGVFNGYYWSGSAWISDSSIVSGLGDIGNYSTPTMFLDNGTWKLISGESDAGTFNGFYWTGSTWTSDSSIVSGLTSVGNNSAPCIFYINGPWSEIKVWEGLAASDLDLNGYGINNGKLVDDLDLNGYNILDGSLGADLDANDYNIVNADTIQAKNTNSLTLKVSTGKSFVFQKV